MSIERPRANLPAIIPIQSTAPPAIDAPKVPTHSPEDHAIEEKFAQLPAVVAQHFRSIDPAVRRQLVTDKRLLSMSNRELVSLFVEFNPYYQSPRETLREMDRKFSDADPKTRAAQSEFTGTETQQYLDYVSRNLRPPSEKSVEDLRRIEAIKRRLLEGPSDPKSSK